jgi:multisubunit Na+/H+ antiporter MnhG subunit
VTGGVRLIRFLGFGLLLAMVVFAAATYGALPDRIPTKLALDGTPLRMGDRSWLGWYGLPALGAAIFALMQGIAAALPKRPHWFNFPDKERFLRLPPPYQAPVIAMMRVILDAAALGTLLSLLVVQLTMWRVANGHAAGALAFVPHFAFLLAPVILILVTRVSEAVEREEKRWRAAEPDRA